MNGRYAYHIVLVEDLAALALKIIAFGSVVLGEVLSTFRWHLRVDE